MSRPPRKLKPSDPDYSDELRRYLQNEEENDSDFSEIDDSDADPDFVIQDEIAPELSDEEEVDSNQLQVHSEQNMQILAGPSTESSDEEETENDLLELRPVENMTAVTVENYSHEEKYFIERTNKTQQVPPNAWSSKPPTAQNTKTPARNIIRCLPGVKGRGRLLGNKPTKTQVWNLFFDEIIIDMIVVNTNTKLQIVRAGLSVETKKNNYRDTDKEEINAFIGLLLVSSVLRSNNEKINSMFSRGPFTRDIYYAAMSQKRFEILLMCLRFDNAATREVRKQNDKAAAISEMFDHFIKNSQSVYSPSASITIDEMLVPFRGRCGFRIYMPKKPKKYGIKILCLCDAKTSYLVNAYIYTGKGSDSLGLTEQEQRLSIPTQAVVKLCKPIIGTNRNITGDNWFTSAEVLDELLKRQLTYLGTVKKDKKLIPQEFLQHPRRRVMSSIYGFRKETTLLSFVPKRNRAVVLASTMHHTIASDEVKRKPEMICDYNTTKCGVDILDMMCAVFSSSRKCRRWPLAIFYRLINIASVNAFIMYTSYKDTEMMNRFNFVKELGYDLIVPHLRKRLSIPSLQRNLREVITRTLGDNKPEAGDVPHEGRGGEVQPEAVPSDRMEKRKTCASCPSFKKRKTAYKCLKCAKAICLECSRKVCIDCSKDVVK